MKVSFVIPTRNESGYLQTAISSISSQKGEFEEEIIVVDGDSSDGTIETAKHLADRVVTGVKGRGNARDAGARQSTGDFIVFLDADTQLEDNFVQELTQFMDREKLSAASCQFRMPGIRSKFIEYSCNHILMRGKEPLLPGFATVVRTEDYIKSGGFDDVLGEDLDFSTNISSTGDTAVLRQKLVETSPRRVSSMGLSGTALYYAAKDVGRRKNIRESMVKSNRLLDAIIG